MDSYSSHAGKLLRRNEHGQWTTCSLESVIVIAANGGVSIREKNHGSLICDIPPRAIQTATVVSDTMIRYNTFSDVKLAVQFEQGDSLVNLLQSYDTNGIAYSKIRNEDDMHHNLFPDCNDPGTQEFLLRLLYSDGLSDFVSDVQQWLQALESKATEFLPTQENDGEENTQSTWQQE